jgi:hypothetical protein
MASTRNNKAEQAYLTLSQFAYRVGEHTRLLKAASEPFHAHYVTLDTDGQKAMRAEWIDGHLQGQGYSADDAAWIASAKRTERAHEDQQAYDRARRDFAYHVVRAEERQHKAEEIEIPRELIEAAKKLAKLANEYEEARKLASKALAMAFAK